jgi:hypothetical protein
VFWSGNKDAKRTDEKQMGKDAQIRASRKGYERKEGTR